MILLHIIIILNYQLKTDESTLSHINKIRIFSVESLQFRTSENNVHIEMNSFLKFTIFLSISCLLTCNADEILSYQEVKEAFNNPENNFFDVREKIELVETGKYPVATNMQSEY